MGSKRIIFISCLFLLLLSLACVSASDFGENSIYSSDESLNAINDSDFGEMNINNNANSFNSDDAIDFKNLDNSYSDDSSDNDVLDKSSLSNDSKFKNSLASSHDKNLLKTSFDDLNTLILHTPDGGELNLSDDYSLSDGGFTITLQKDITINGNGHSLNGGENSRIFYIGRGGLSIVLKDLTLEQGFTQDYGAALFNNFSSTRFTLINCTLQYNDASGVFDGFGGGTIFTKGNLNVINSTFHSNNLAFGFGGAIYCRGDLFINNTTFDDNWIDPNTYNPSIAGNERGNDITNLEDNLYAHRGGAIYSYGNCTIYNSEFWVNIAGANDNRTKSYGGAIYSHGDLHVYNTNFTGNEARVENGGAIYCEGNLYGDSLIFSENNAYSGCAIYCEAETHISHSQFIKNIHVENSTQKDYDWMSPTHLDPALVIVSSCGGGIYSVGKCYIDSCTFDNNIVCEMGGAIYAASDLTITGQNRFKENEVSRHFYFDINILAYRWVDKRGGAIYCNGTANINNANFSDNLAFVDGGAIYANGKCTVKNCNFDENTAHGIDLRSPMGGAIRSNGTLTVDNCSFDSNNADVSGGAIYADGKSYIYNSNFKNNYDEAGIALVYDYGGAIRSKGSITIDNCSFEDNHNANYGGAIYTEGNINVNHSSFSGNKARSLDGGAIYCEGDAVIDYSNFTKNNAEIDGGAVFCRGKTTVSNSNFNSNKANGDYYEKSLGGAVCSKGTVKVSNSTFEGNHANRHGGAIYGDDDVIISGSSFDDNSADVDGGAVYADAGAKISDSAFSGNEVTGKTIEKSYGGAIRANEFITVKNSKFEDNVAPNLGGAFYVDGDTEISDSSFSGNKVDVDGGAVYSEGKTTISGSAFENNKATGDKDPRSFGGAVRSNGETTVINSIFNNNFAYNNGGAIYADKKITIEGSSFKGNEANDDGGAVCSDGDAIISNSNFTKNKVLGKTARRSFGGGVCSYGKATLDSCSFKDNYADNRGGGIFAFEEIRISYSNFTGNTAKKYGGAVYTRTINHEITHSIFINNNVREEDGGAIYINNSCSPSFISCRFEDNRANEEGGAIYLDSQKAELTLRYCTFVDNKAGKSGQSVFDCGYYDTVSMCWFGKNYVTFKDELKIWHKAKANEDYKPDTHLYLNLTVDGSELYVGNTYKLAGYLYVPSALKPYYISQDLLHSSAKLSGDGIFSNAKVDLNNITAEVVFTKENPTIYLTLDHQTVSLSINVTNKHQSKVNIISCDDVTYPNAFYAKYEILNMTDGANYEIMDSKGNIVRSGNITNPKSTLSIDGLDLGDYSLWIFNPENFSTVSSLDHKYFKVTGTTHTIATADNVTYGSPTTITLRANSDGLYNVTINATTGDLTIQMNVVDGVCVEQVNLRAGEYQTHTSGGDYISLNSSEALFKVDPAINNIVAEVEDVIYGESSLIKIKADFDAIYTVDVNGTEYLIQTYNGFGNKSVSLDTGRYYANVSSFYIGNVNYITCCKNATFEVYKADINLSLVIRDQYYQRDVEGIAYASVDGEYNLTFGNERGYNQSTVIVKDNVGHFNLGPLNSGEYDANISFAGNNNYNSCWNKTSFEVFRPSTSFEIYITPSTVAYGETATVMPIVSTGATGTVKYYVYGGDILGELDVGKNFNLPILDVGTYVIMANYSGDVNFSPARDSGSFTVKPALNKANVTVDNVNYGEDALIRVCADVDGVYGLDLNGTFYNVTVENGLGNISLPLDAGIYWANLNFENKNYNTIIKNASFEVYKADVNLTIEVSDIVYPQEFKGIVRSDVDGIYNFTVDDYSTTLLVQDGIAHFDLGLLDAGSYRVTANYSGSRNYNPAKCTVLVNVNLALNSAVVSVDNVVYGEESVIVVCADADGIYQVDINGTIYNIEVRNGVGNRPVRLNAGSYCANLSFNNINYNTSFQNASFEVYKADIDLVVVVFDEVYPQDIEGIVYASVDGEYNLTVDNYLTLISVKDNLAYFNMGTMDAGTYKANVSFAGNNNYNPAFNATSFTVYPYGTLFEIEVNPSIFIYGGTANVTHSLSEGASGTIKYFLHDGTFLGELDVSENLTLPVLDVGTYVIIANYSGDIDFSPALDAELFVVNPALNSAVVSVDNVTYGEESLILVSADIDGIYQVDINGTAYNILVKNGVGNKSIPLDAGIYYANVTFKTNNYNTSSYNAIFEVYKANINLTIEVSDIVYPQEFKGTVRSDVDGIYNFTVDDYSTTLLVQDSIAHFDLGLLDAGSYRVTANYSGSRNYNPASFNVFVNVTPALNSAVVSVDNVAYGEESLIVVCADADGNYQVDINGTIYNVKVSNGIGNRSVRLNTGRYYANLSFNNINYNTSFQNDNFEVYKADVDLVVFVLDVIYPQDIDGLVYASADGEYNLTVNNNSTLITVIDNFAFFNMGAMDAGMYEANVSFAGNDNYNPAFNKTSFTVYPFCTLFEIEVNPSLIGYGGTANVTHSLSEGASGTIKYYLHDGTFLGELDVSENLALPVLDVGTYVIIANYSGDRNFISAADSFLFAVYPGLNDAVVSADNVTYGEESLIVVSADIDGIYQVDINGTAYNISVENGVGNRSVALDAGVYYANVTFDNKNYNTNSYNAIFEVYKANINLTIETSDILYPQEFKGLVHSNLDGEYNFTVDGNTTALLVKEGLGEFNLGVLVPASYQINVDCYGNRNYNPASETVLVSVKPGLNDAVVSADNVTYGEESLIVVSANVDGVYQLDVNGTVYNISVENGAGNMSIALDAGVYYANMTFDNKNYNTTAHNAVFEVYKAPVDIFVAAFDTVYPQEIEGIIYSNVDGEYNLTIGGYSTIVIVKDGRAEYNAGVFDAGNYTVLVRYSGDFNHYSNSSSREVAVDKITPNITLNVSDIDYGGVAIISISCDVSGSVNVTVNGITETLDLNGQSKNRLFASVLSASGYGATLSLYNLDSGSYPVTVSYNGDKNIESITLSGEFNVNAVNVLMDIGANDIKVGDDETITVKLSSNASGNIVIAVDGKNYTAELNDGKASLTIFGLSAGSKTADVYYPGDRNHNPAMGNVSFEVKKIKPNMSVISNDPISKGEKLHIIVKLPSDASGNVTITIDGKNYTAPVKNGKSIFDISGLDAGKYDLAAYYSGDDKYEADEIELVVTVKDNGNNHNNHTDNNHSDNNVSPSDLELNSTGNPIAVLLLALITIGFTTIRRFKK